MDNNEQYPAYGNEQNGYYNGQYAPYDNTYQGQPNAYQNGYRGYPNDYQNAYQNSYPNGYQNVNPNGQPQRDTYVSPYTVEGFYSSNALVMPYVKPKREIRWKLWLLVIAIAVALGGYAWYLINNVGYRNSIPGLEPPTQSETFGGVQKNVDGYSVEISFKYTYSLDALVVSTKEYDGSGLADKLSPVDLGLAWGDVAANNEKVDFHWEQRGRWIYWQLDSYSDLMTVGGEQNIECQVSNNHIIPATKDVKKQALKIRRGDRVRLEGYLVDVSAQRSDGAWFEWDSSTTREDTGDGACEVFYVTKVEIVDQ